MKNRHPFPPSLSGLQLGRAADATWLVRLHDDADWITLELPPSATSRDAIRACRSLPEGWARQTPSHHASTPLSAPAFRPGKIVAVAANYAAHAAEVGLDTRGDLVIFAKFPTSLTGPFDPILVDPDITTEVDYETELAIVIGHTIGPRRRPLALEQAVFGYTVANDISARDIQRLGNRLTHAKSLDTFLPLGPWITRPGPDVDVDDLHLATIVNGVERQSATTALMRRDVATLVREISQQITLEPGDIILTGSPAGSAAGQATPQFLADEDVVESRIEHLGSMRNVITTSRASMRAELTTPDPPVPRESCRSKRNCMTLMTLI